jgi:predicted porin
LFAAHESREANYRADGYSKGTDFSLHYLYALTRKIGLDAGAHYTRNKYESGKKDDIYTLSFRAGYALSSWLKAYFEYKYEKKDADGELASYKNNVYTLGAAIMF